MRKVFATTRNVERFFAGMQAVESTDQGRVGMGLVFGEPGLGKTECAQKYAADGGHPYVRATHIMTPRSLLSAVVAELGEAPAFRTDDLFNQAVEQLLERPRTVIVDEVDYLIPSGAVEVLRDLNDITNCPVVLVGMHQADRKLQRFRHLCDRFTAVVRFELFTPDDIADLARQICEVELDRSAVEWVHQQCGGKFRRAMLHFARAERVARANGVDRVSAEHLRRPNGGGR